MRMRSYQNLHRPSGRREVSRGDGLFLVLAIGALLLASLLIPRSPREPLRLDTTGSSAQLAVVDQTPPAAAGTGSSL